MDSKEVSKIPHITQQVKNPQNIPFDEGKPSDVKKGVTSDEKKAYTDMMEIDETDYKYCPGNETVKSNLFALLLPHFPNVQIYLFGSREIGTATKTSDLDLYVDTDRSYHVLALDKLDVITQTLKKVTNILKANPIEWSNVTPIDASVPIVKAFNNLEMIQCDISFSDGLGYINTILMKELCALQPIFRSMIIILERWLKMTEQSNYITSYTLKLLVMHYLQTRRNLPIVRKVQKGLDLDKSSFIGPWKVFFTLPHELKRRGKLELHITRFFKMYSSPTKFTDIIATYKGCSENKSMALDALKSKSYKRYQNFIKMYGSKVAYVYNNINVQGPFDFASNPGKNVSKEQLDNFIRLSKLSYNTLRLFKK